MKNKLNTFFSKLLLLSLPMVLTFCGDDESGNSGFSYKIDGKSQKVQTVSGIMEFEVQYDHEGRAVYLTAAAGFEKMLSISISNWDFQNPDENGIIEKEYDATMDFEGGTDNPLAECLELAGEGVTLCDGSLVTYIVGSDVYTSVFDGNTSGIVTVTSCNAAKKTISGTFSAKVADFDGVQQYTVTGSFNNVKYMVF
jgi:hypothetical protein